MGAYGSPEFLPFGNAPQKSNSSLVTCEKCGFRYSKSFRYCPRCGTHKSHGWSYYFAWFFAIFVVILFTYISMVWDMHDYHSDTLKNDNHDNTTLNNTLTPNPPRRIDENSTYAGGVVKTSKDEDNVSKSDVSTPTITIGQSNALKKAKSYLTFTSFSRSGLIDQLKFEWFTDDEAIYGVNNCGADWNEQAAKKLKAI